MKLLYFVVACLPKASHLSGRTSLCVLFLKLNSILILPSSLPMNYDAQEAALGLLGLCPNNLSPLVTTPTIPAKRKQGPNSTIIIRDQRDDSNDNSSDKKDNSQEDIRCICGFTYDDGFSIACDDCSRWCHAACFDIVEGEVPEEWFCWECFPRPVDSERAARFQRERLKGLQVGPEK